MHDNILARLLFQICSQMPSMQDVFRFNPSSILTIRKLNALLAPQFSPTGSNRRRFEGAVYAAFCKYVREVAGMCGYVFEKKLQFLGSFLLFHTFKINPSPSVYYPFWLQKIISPFRIVLGILHPPLLMFFVIKRHKKKNLWNCLFNLPEHYSYNFRWTSGRCYIGTHTAVCNLNWWRAIIGVHSSTVNYIPRIYAIIFAHGKYMRKCYDSTSCICNCTTAPWPNAVGDIRWSFLKCIFWKYVSVMLIYDSVIIRLLVKWQQDVIKFGWHSE